jgi:hypothetical protein
MITKRDLQIEKLLREMGDKPPHSNATHTVRFDRDIFYYNKDEVARQARLAERIDGVRMTYEDHIRAIKIARHMLGKDTQADIAMAILSHRYFKDYRAKAFKGKGSFREDFTFIVTKVGNVLDTKTSRIIPPDVTAKLNEYKEPTLVQINHLIGSIQTVKTPTTLSLQDWATKLNAGASETTTYAVAGRKL